MSNEKRLIRQGQLISPWGVGQMINFPKGESLMVAGLDAWEETYRSAQTKEEFIIEEDRLKQRLGVDHFRLPPDFRSGQSVQNPELSIPFVRFPQWHYCYWCGGMEFLSLYDNNLMRCRGYNFGDRRSCHTWNERKRQYLMPVRFVAICGKGHIQDFPFMEWVHKGKSFGQDCKLRYTIRPSASALGAIKISCSCGANNSMMNSFEKNALSNLGIKCCGQRPWLGETNEEARGCSEDLHTVQRGASNVYFPIVRSSIYLPSLEDTFDPKINDIIEKYWHILKTKKDGKLMKNKFDTIAELKNVDATELYEAGLKRDLQFSALDKQNEKEEDFRMAEYKAMNDLIGKSTRDLYITSKNNNLYSNLFQKFFRNILLLHKLRETRALAGFSRLLPQDGSDDIFKKNQLSINPLNWLPAITVKGEGIFFDFNPELINSWANQKEVQARATILIDNYNKGRLGFSLPERVLNSRFILLHSFAHIIINQLSYQCGYGTSSIRERIYCSIESEDSNTNGILLYTASGDSEGSMGGLVKQGEPGNLEKIVESALNKAEWCSSDPICVDSKGQGPGSCNLAACHNCALLPETSCEEGNRLLDRGLLVGLYNKPDMGFFKYSHL
ncbi:MAG: DUF1998 domain-containing protein [Patescibacteria group bacterium]